MNRLVLYSALLLLTQCSKCKNNDPAPEAQLPPATQTGANTFGCLVNGEPFTPAGRVGGTANLSFEYDPTFNGGRLAVDAYRAGNGQQQAVLLIAEPVTSTGIYSFSYPGPAIAQLTYRDSRLPRSCSETYGTGSMAYCRGTLTVTRLDDAAGIVSGTFDVKFVRDQGNCDTVRITNGRFDVKR